MSIAIAKSYDFHSLSKLVRRGLVTSPPATLPTGLYGLDGLLPGGGLPLGHLTELAGGPASGKLSLALTLLARSVARDEGAALLDPGATAMPDVWSDPWLTRLLVVRGGGLASALRAADALLKSNVFAVVALDLTGMVGTEPGLRSHLQRLTREARATDTALLLLVDTAGSDASSLSSLRLTIRRTYGRLQVTVTRSRLGREGAHTELDLSPTALSNHRPKKEGDPCASPAFTSPTSPYGSCAARTQR